MESKELVIWAALPWESARSLDRAFVSVLSRAVREKRKENHNKTTTKCSTNPAVNESGSLQHFFYALLIPQGDKHNAEPAPSATSPTPLHCKHCGLPHFMSVNPFKPTGKYSCQSGQRAFGWRKAPSVGHTGGPSFFIYGCPTCWPEGWGKSITMIWKRNPFLVMTLGMCPSKF